MRVLAVLGRARLGCSGARYGVYQGVSALFRGRTNNYSLARGLRVLHEREVTRVLGKLSFFRKAAIWPVEVTIDPEGWLTNFEPDEMDVAVALLDFFSYFAPEVTKKILVAGFHRLSCHATDPSALFVERNRRWGDFCANLIVTYPTDERPGATDSGRSYLRKARGLLGLNQQQYMDPPDALAARLNRPDRALLFLDDFAGSGNQFCQTWVRQYTVGGRRSSFKSAGGSGLVGYLPVLCSYQAVEAIARCAPTVLLLPGHTLGEEYSALHPKSLLWPSDELRTRSYSVLYEASKRAGIPLGDGSDPDDWCGYQALGLAVAIDDTIPDACLTLLYWNEKGWRPLFRRP